MVICSTIIMRKFLLKCLFFFLSKCKAGFTSAYFNDLEVKYLVYPTYVDDQWVQTGNSSYFISDTNSGILIN